MFVDVSRGLIRGFQENPVRQFILKWRGWPRVWDVVVRDNGRAGKSRNGSVPGQGPHYGESIPDLMFALRDQV